MPNSQVNTAQQQPTAGDAPTQIFLFSVAINTYASDDVSNLSGCVKDAERLISQLQESFGIPDAHICTLTNEEATRVNIIKHFRAHFSQLQEGDTAIFHYSGHGAQEPAHPAFIKAGIENPGGYHEMLVVHDCGQDGVYNLADKELRLLIAELQQVRDIQFLGLMDCCFSGSIFRAKAGEYVRRTELGISQPRPLEEYLGGYYAKQLAATRTVELPQASFTLFTASSPGEYAYEGSDGGLFTKNLCNLLAHYAPPLPSYADIHTELYHAVAVQSKNYQHPYLEYSGKASPFRQFLGQTGQPPAVLPPLVQRENEWLVSLGAIHGIRAESWQDTPLTVWQGREPVATASLKRVELEHTVVDLPAHALDNLPESGGTLRLGIYPSRLALSWQVPPEHEEAAEVLRQQLQQRGLALQLEELATAPYQIVVDATHFQLLHQDKLIVGVAYSEHPTEAADCLAQYLSYILRWTQMDAVRLPRRTSLPAQQVHCSFSYKDNTEEGTQITIYPQGEKATGISTLTIPLKADQTYVTFRVEVLNDDDYPCYCYLVHLGSRYAMHQLFEAFDKPLRYNQRLSYDSLKQKEPTALGFVEPATQMTKDIFLLFFSRTPFVAPYRFEQRGLEESYGQLLTIEQATRQLKRSLIRLSRLNPIPNWTMKRLEVNLVREDA